MKITDTHIYFYGGIYSNWYSRDGLIKDEEGHIFSNSEQYFMYQKALFFKDLETAQKILEAHDPRQSKALGRMVKNYDEKAWDKYRYCKMFLANLDKFSQNQDLGGELRETGDKILVEASPYDKIWGVGLAENDPLILDDKNWRGKNLLGQVLIDVRHAIR